MKQLYHIIKNWFYIREFKKKIKINQTNPELLLEMITKFNVELLTPYRPRDGKDVITVFHGNIEHYSDHVAQLVKLLDKEALIKPEAVNATIHTIPIDLFLRTSDNNIVPIVEGVSIFLDNFSELCRLMLGAEKEKSGVKENNFRRIKPFLYQGQCIMLALYTIADSINQRGSDEYQNH